MMFGPIVLQTALQPRNYFAFVVHFALRPMRACNF
jgi:hypothetical protein